MKQIIESGIEGFDTIVAQLQSRKFLFVIDSSFHFLPLKVKRIIDQSSIDSIVFNDFTPNPLYNDVKKGVELFTQHECDAIVAVGGGSTIDVAKCIKLFCKMDMKKNLLNQEYKDTKIPFIAIPTTAGTGSESTKYAVIYYEGNKQSVTHESVIPNFVILEPEVLKSLPVYQKKCTLLDALCQAIESWWSINSTDESVFFSENAIRMIIENYKDYLYKSNNFEKSAKKIISAANFSGRAINITQTTAAHAMSYKLTSLFNLPHGHSVALCLPRIWEFMYGNLTSCIDVRGTDYLIKTFKKISEALGCRDVISGISCFDNLLNELNIGYPDGSEKDIEMLTQSVNLTRLRNNPVSLSSGELSKIYHRIVRTK